MNDMELLQTINIKQDMKQNMIDSLMKLKNNKLIQIAILSNFQNNQEILKNNPDMKKTLELKNFCINKLSDNEIEKMVLLYINQLKGGIKDDF